MRVQVPRTPIAQRSAGPPPDIREGGCCLRCSKVIDEAVVCVRERPWKNCTRCAGMNHPCFEVRSPLACRWHNADMKQVPPNFNARVNELLSLRTRMNTATGALRDRLGVQLAETQLEYTRDVGGTKRKDDRQGGTRKPTAAEIPGLQLFASQRQARALEGI